MITHKNCELLFPAATYRQSTKAVCMCTSYTHQFSDTAVSFLIIFIYLIHTAVNIKVGKATNIISLLLAHIVVTWIVHRVGINRLRDQQRIRAKSIVGPMNTDTKRIG